MPHEGIHDRFSSLFDRECTAVARAPGRVNLIGDHTDYNDGLVLPIAVQLETVVAAAPRDNHVVRAYSRQFDQMASWSIGGWAASAQPHWTSYVAGVIENIRTGGAQVLGLDLLVESDIPVGGGLSSSAALELATALAAGRFCDAWLDPLKLIDLCRAAEHEFAGVPCGIMDQTASLSARAGHALLLDCRDRSIQHISCDQDEHAFFVVDSGVRHELASGEYARRREQCARAVEYFTGRDPAVRSLRDVTPGLLDSAGEDLDAVIARRTRHVISENQRVLACADALRARNLTTFGELMGESHRSLRHDYEVSCEELDRIVETVEQIDGVLGARMTGGGFGGCVVILGKVDSNGAINAALARRFGKVGRKPAKALRCLPSNGASLTIA